jgi:enterochelin esterase-like enzyme
MPPVERAPSGAADRARIYVHHPLAADCTLRTSEDWSRSLQPKSRRDGVSEFEAPLARGAQFKVTLGSSWATGPNVVLKQSEVHVSPTFAQGAGKVSTLFSGFYSHVLGNTRDVRVYLPPGYEENPERRYPVVYFQDGQKVFTGHGDQPVGSWAAERALDHLIGTGRVAPAIAVGVDNVGEVRNAEYGPERGDRYLQFMARELKPEVDRWLHTKADPRHVAMVGSSMGGWITLYAGHTEPALGNKVGALSSAAWFDHDLLPRLVRSGKLDVAPFQAPDARVWTDYGKAHWDTEDRKDNIDNGRGNEVLWRAYASRGLPVAESGPFQAHVIPIPEGRTPHSEPAWADRLPAVLEHILEPWKED